MDLHHVQSVLERAGVTFLRGLTDAQFERAQARFDFVFPADLRRFLAHALPLGRGWPDWRDPDSRELASQMAEPLEGLVFDAEQNDLWLDAYGPRPADRDAARRQLQACVERAPRLVPICGHRYMPDRPAREGNPVLSVHQTDIILYGADLENYLHNEFHTWFGTPAYAIGEDVRQVEFWSGFVE